MRFIKVHRKDTVNTTYINPDNISVMDTVDGFTCIRFNNGKHNIFVTETMASIANQLKDD